MWSLTNDWVTGFLVAIVVVSNARADHLPVELQAKGKSEKTLARIHLERSRLKDILRTYGKPSQIKKTPAAPDSSIVDEEYYWKLSGVTVRVLLLRGPGIHHGEYTQLIEVEGSKPGITGRTGAGLKLGDNKAALKRTYGSRFKERDIPKRGIHDIMVQWRDKEISLVVELSHSGRIKKMSLSAPE